VIKGLGAGSLRDRITVTRASEAPNGKGGKTKVTATIADSVPASITVKRGGEVVQAQRLGAQTPYEIVVRYDINTANITSRDTITDGNGVVYAIDWVGSLDEGRKRWLLIEAKTGTVANR
jgi:head-tail adaptor